jgi:hypothetical protein
LLAHQQVPMWNQRMARVLPVRFITKWRQGPRKEISISCSCDNWPGFSPALFETIVNLGY